LQNDLHFKVRFLNRRMKDGLPDKTYPIRFQGMGLFGSGGNSYGDCHGEPKDKAHSAVHENFLRNTAPPSRAFPPGH
jgi:hypothetical protein